MFLFYYSHTNPYQRDRSRILKRFTGNTACTKISLFGHFWGSHPRKSTTTAKQLVDISTQGQSKECIDDCSTEWVRGSRENPVKKAQDVIHTYTSSSPVNQWPSILLLVSQQIVCCTRISYHQPTDDAEINHSLVNKIQWKTENGTNRLEPFLLYK